MIKNNNLVNIMTITCDECGKSSEADSTNGWLKALDKLKKRGWVVEYRGPGKYKHYCKRCVGE